jgi:Tol biopolymer transport system component
MKQCPSCKQVYYDETLNYCLDDGKRLIVANYENEPPTAVLTAKKAGSEVPTRRIANVSDPHQEAHPTLSADDLLVQVKRHKFGTLFGVGALALLVIFAAVGIYKSVGPKAVESVPSALKVTRLTSSGRVFFPAISPDGKYVAYVQRSATEKESLWLRQVSAASEIQILPEEPGITFAGVTFMPDSEHIVVVKSNQGHGSLWRLPVLGGNAKKLPIENVSPRNVSLSPDGKRIAFFRRDANEKGNHIFIANIDGSGEKILLTSQPGMSFTSTPVWSPDGKSMAIAKGLVGEGFLVSAVEISIEDGTEKPIGDFRWAGSQTVYISWLSDASGVVLNAAENIGLNPQIWLIPRSGGKARKITTELSEYSYVSMTADSSTICATRAVSTINLWVADADNIDGARRITSGAERRDGARGISWFPDGSRLLVFSTANGEPHIWAMAADGSGSQMVTNSARRNRDAQVSPDGKYIVWESNSGEGNAIWRMNSDGGNPVRLTEGPFDYRPDISPDGNWVVYSSDPIVGAHSTWKTSINGGTPTLLTDHINSFGPVISPDGSQIAFGELNDSNELSKILIIPFGGGPVMKALELPERSLGPVRWALDGKAIDYIRHVEGVSNLWRQPLGGGEAKQLTHFNDLRIWNFAWSRDGKRIALSRGSSERDVLLIKDFGQ